MEEVKLPTPKASIMNPSWLMVENAKIRLISRCVKAINAANRAVNTPIQAITVSAPGNTWKIAKERAIRYTPATTMVAA